MKVEMIPIDRIDVPEESVRSIKIGTMEEINSIFLELKP